MMNRDDMRGRLNYDPSDRTSFPYQTVLTEGDLPFGQHSLQLDPSTIDHAADLDVMETIDKMCGYDNDGPDNYLMLDMALRLLINIQGDSAYEGIPLPDLFAACCDTSMIWLWG